MNTYMYGVGRGWALRVTHIPTGIIIDSGSQFFRSQHKARDAAIKRLRSKIWMLTNMPTEATDLEVTIDSSGLLQFMTNK
jgi:protein subunit release factor A